MLPFQSLQGKIDKLFSKPMPSSKLPTKSEKSSGQVLNSSETLQEKGKSAARKQKELRQKKKANKSQQQA